MCLSVCYANTVRLPPEGARRGKCRVTSTEQINRFQQIFPELFIRSAEALNHVKSALFHSWGWVRSMPGMSIVQTRLSQQC